MSATGSSLTPITDSKKTYSTVLRTQAMIHNELSRSNSTIEEEVETIFEARGKEKNKKKNENKKKQQAQDVTQVARNEEYERNEEEISNEEHEQNKRKFNFKKFILKIKAIVSKDHSIEEKISLFVKLVIEEIKSYFVDMFCRGEAVECIFKNLLNG